MKLLLASIALAVALPYFAFTGAAAAAEEPPTEPAARAEGVMPPPPYASPLRDECTAELRKDARWRAELRKQLRDKIHDEDAALMLRNKRHVVYAYASIWILSVLFLVRLWWRQRRLTAEIEQLRADVRRGRRPEEG